MWNPKVSIVIPVYNGSNFLREAIDSAIAQAYQNLEILVVNDGSTDDGATEQIALSYGDKIRYFSKPNGGVSTALNLGIEKMSGEYFSWLSHDDVYEETKVSTQVEFLSKQTQRKSVVFSDISLVNTNNTEMTRVSARHLNPERLEFELLLDQSIHGCALLIHRDLFYEVGIFNVNLRSTQDYDLWLRMARYTQFHYCSGALIRSRIHKDQGSRSRVHLEELREFYQRELLNLNLESIQKKFDSKELRKVWSRLILKTDEIGGLENIRRFLTEQATLTTGSINPFFLQLEILKGRFKKCFKARAIKLIKLLHALKTT